MNGPYLFATLLAAAAATSAASAADQATPALVTVDGDAITVVADGAPLKELLTRLRDQGGFSLVESTAPMQRPVTAHLDRVSWREGLAELLQGYRYALAMDSETNRPSTLVILSSEVAQPVAEERIEAAASAAEVAGPEVANPAPKAMESSLEEATRLANELAAQQEDPLAFAMRSAREAAAEAEAERAALAREQERTVSQGEEGSQQTRRGGPGTGYDRYAESIRALGRFQDPERLDVLSPALDSDSQAIRNAALEALRDGTVNDDAVLDQVRGMVMGDADFGVQRNALEVFARYGDPSEVLSLVQSLGRTNGPTRDIAVREWMRIEKEQADATLADQQLQSAKSRR